MNTLNAWHSLRELALAGAETPADKMTVYQALAEVGEKLGLTREAKTALTIAAGINGEETMELLFNDLLSGKEPHD